VQTADGGPQRPARIRRRDRHGRGLRGVLVPPEVPLHRTRAERFDDLVLQAVARLEPQWEAHLSGIEFVVEEIPPADAPATGPRGPVPLSRLDLGQAQARPPEPRDAGPGNAGPGNVGPEDAGPEDAGPGNAGPEDAGPGNAGLEDAGPGNAGPPDPGQRDPEQQDPGQQDPGQQDPGQQDPGQQDPGQQDPGQQDPGQQDPGQQDPGQRAAGPRPDALIGGEADGEAGPDGQDPPRIVVYRRPLMARADGEEDLSELVFDVVVEEFARLLGIDPKDVDSGYAGGD
jgi:predicted Zn-dependent protease with MMP-like domain